MKNLYLTMIALGIIQGIAEFLPISSSGHLVLFEQLPFFQQALAQIGDNLELFVNVSLHLATLLAVIIYMHKDIWMILKGFFGALISRNFNDSNFRLALWILSASIPAGVLGILFNDFLETLFSSYLAVSIMLLLNSAVLLSTKFISKGSRKLNEIGTLRSIVVGFFQAAAIIPGISRSGMTISGGMLNGIDPEDSARFSFLMALPVIAGAGLIETVKVSSANLAGEFFTALFVGMAICVVVALISMKILFIIVKKSKLDYFGYYTALAGICGIVVYIVHH